MTTSVTLGELLNDYINLDKSLIVKSKIITPSKYVTNTVDVQGQLTRKISIEHLLKKYLTLDNILKLSNIETKRSFIINLDNVKVCISKEVIN